MQKQYKVFSIEPTKVPAKAKTDAGVEIEAEVTAYRIQLTPVDPADGTFSLVAYEKFELEIGAAVTVTVQYA